jgi:hypothetical protein
MGIWRGRRNEFFFVLFVLFVLFGDEVKLCNLVG